MTKTAPRKTDAENKSWQPGQKGQGGEGMSKGYGGSGGKGTGPSGPDSDKPSGKQREPRKAAPTSLPTPETIEQVLR